MGSSSWAHCLCLSCWTLSPHASRAANWQNACFNWPDCFVYVHSAHLKMFWSIKQNMCLLIHDFSVFELQLYSSDCTIWPNQTDMFPASRELFSQTDSICLPKAAADLSDSERFCFFQSDTSDSRNPPGSLSLHLPLSCSFNTISDQSPSTTGGFA